MLVAALKLNLFFKDVLKSSICSFEDIIITFQDYSNNAMIIINVKLTFNPSPLL